MQFFTGRIICKIFVMTISRAIVVSHLAVIMLLQPVYSQQFINKNEPETLNRTVFFDLKLNNCPEDVGAAINADIRRRLKSIPNLQLVSPDEMGAVLDT